MKEAIEKISEEMKEVELHLKDAQGNLSQAEAAMQAARNKVLELQIKHKGLSEAKALLEGDKNGEASKAK